MVHTENGDMDMTDTMSQQRVLIVGLGKTGLSCARFLASKGIEVAITDSRTEPPALEQLNDELPGVAVFVGGFDAEAFSRATTIVVSPGVSLREPLIAEARVRGVEVIGDIELFARNVDAPVIAITGSNGKTTVTSMLGEMAKTAGMDVRVGGNIGVPALELLTDKVPDVYVLELSSFQLETTESLNAYASVILNISEDHMDRYHDLADYTAAKAKVYHGSGVLVVNFDDQRVVATADIIRHGRNITGFTQGKPENDYYGVCHKGESEWLCKGDQLLMPVSDVKVKGKHNIANALAAIALGSSVNIPLEAMLASLKSFPGLPHRSQWVASVNGVDWYNDSKATNIGATVAAMQGISADNIILIAGGQGKSQDFNELRDVMSENIKSVILFGEDAKIIHVAIEDKVATTFVDSLAQAVTEAAKLASPGDAVLLSPACASFDMFSGYEDRGNAFIQLVQELNK